MHVNSNRMRLGTEIKRGTEFIVYEFGEGEVLKIPRRSWLMNIAFGNFHRKNEEDMHFLSTYFSEFLPVTQILELPDGWAIRQQKITGSLFFKNPRMTDSVRILFRRAIDTFHTTGKIPDLLNPGNLIIQEKTERLFMIDTSALGGKKIWPVGYLVSRFFAKVLYDTMTGWLKKGF